MGGRDAPHRREPRALARRPARRRRASAARAGGAAGRPRDGLQRAGERGGPGRRARAAEAIARRCGWPTARARGPRRARPRPLPEARGDSPAAIAVLKRALTELEDADADLAEAAPDRGHLLGVHLARRAPARRRRARGDLRARRRADGAGPPAPDRPRGRGRHPGPAGRALRRAGAARALRGGGQHGRPRPHHRRDGAPVHRALRRGRARCTAGRSTTPAGSAPTPASRRPPALARCCSTGSGG